MKSLMLIQIFTLDLIRMLDKLRTIILFNFDAQAMSRYMRRWKIAEVGNNSWVSTNARFDRFVPPGVNHSAMITIGTHCFISEYCQFIIHDTSKIHFLKVFNQPIKRKWAPIIVKDNVFIGAGSIILPGVTLSQNCLIGAGAVVTNNTVSDSVYAGNPAKRIMSIKDYLTK